MQLVKVHREHKINIFFFLNIAVFNKALCFEGISYFSLNTDWVFCSIDAMLNLFLLASLYQLYTCQLLYQPLVANNTILDKGIESELHLVLNGCEESLQSEKKESRELSRNAEQLTNQMETTRMALMALQQQYNVTGKHCIVRFIQYSTSLYINLHRFWRMDINFSL